MNFEFMGGSMGSVVGEKLAEALERGASEKNSGCNCCYQRWSKNARRNFLIDANGENFGCR
jgi:acetyl-CoA carboxylase beta subunit